MELSRLLAALSDPAAYPFAVGRVEVRQTHISAVFLAGSFAYKIKKPVRLGFVDFSTLSRRRHFCAEEVRLNRRLAPEVYLGVVPVARVGNDLKVEGSAGEVVEWAVKMQRLPEAATLQKRLRRGEITAAQLTALARKVAAFHAAAEGSERIAAFGRFEVVAQNARENFSQSAAQVGVTVSPGVFARLQELTEEALAQLRPLIESRARRGVPRDTHGDLHLDHVYLFPERPPPADLVIIDCIEFNERFRYADPVADAAFVVMDLIFHGRRDLADSFADAYLSAAQDAEGRALLPFYTAYRAAVRGKVEGLRSVEGEVPEAERSAARQRARAYWLLALGQLEEPGRRPCLLLVSGVPGSGKSTLARGLAERASFAVIRSDVVRKELAGLAAADHSRTAYAGGIYTAEWNERTYAECLRRAERLLFEGRRVLVDASFREESRRRAFLEAAERWGVPGAFLLCRAGPAAIRDRLAHRRGDVSDADWLIAQQAAAHWEEAGPRTRAVLHAVSTDGSREEALADALAIVRQLGL
jgi:aminoglycoside phosphotransferase family enzyme/predicted kinase